MLLTLKQRAYQMIRDKLLTGMVRPGSRLSDDLLARELGISRSPVREAISQLASEGLVEHRPRLGAFVKQPERRELEAYYEIRRTLECYAARKAALRISAESVAQLRRLYREMFSLAQECRAIAAKAPPPELMRRFFANDLAFHTVILHAADNSPLTKLVTDFKILIQIFSFLETEPALQHDFDSLFTTYRYHRRIARSLQRRDAKAAAVWMARHIRDSQTRTLRDF
jgi:DNA-binding GntR family transcriptional regulator